MSRRDLAHVLAALAELSGGRAGAGVPVSAIDEAIGRHGDDMRTPLNLADLAADGRVERLPDGRWALTEAGVDWIAQDRELSDR
jgi:alkanesulfonate monooxygenase SsuD/methylene tetrahydromethanopterin reductase-like flavin-dependent oxidoreductase (luciferase family)